MNTFPTLTYSPKFESFSDIPLDDAVLVGDAASGYPVLNKLFTFSGRTFRFTLIDVLETDKLAIMAFYEANKDVPFYWYNDQDKTTYEVAFIGIPIPTIGIRFDIWNIELVLRQTTP